MTYLLYVGPAHYEIHDTYLAVRQLAHDLYVVHGHRQNIEVRLVPSFWTWVLGIGQHRENNLPVLVLLAKEKEKQR